MYMEEEDENDIKLLNPVSHCKLKGDPKSIEFENYVSQKLKMKIVTYGFFVADGIKELS